MNSDDFTDGPDPVHCLDTRYGFWITGVYDGGAVRHQGYYYSDSVGGYYDIVDIKGGNMRVRSTGLTRDQNYCELESLWYHKAAFGEWECTEPVEEHLELCIVDIDTTVDPPETTWGSWRLVYPVDYGYAPDGMPDFPQEALYNFCGPVALANCLWWCFAGGFPNYIIWNWYSAWDPSIPPQLINELAQCMNTGAQGTNVYDMEQCILDLNETYGFWLTETTIVQPTFEDIEYQVRLSQDVILLLGYWYAEVIDSVPIERVVTGYFDYELGLQPEPPPPFESVQWHQIWPPEAYCTGWHQDAWIDNGDNKLSYCDTLYMSMKPELEIKKKWHIENVTRTLMIKPNEFDTFYVDFVDTSTLAPYDTFYWEPVVAETCSYWHVVWPPKWHCEVWHLASIQDNNASGYIDFCDTIDFDTPWGKKYFHVRNVATNITASYVDTIGWEPVYGDWLRLGGHYVTVSGVNWEFFLLSLSDPFIDGFCSGLTPGDSSGGVFLAHDHSAGCHFDAGNVSHDYYQVALTSPSPGGVISIPYYQPYDTLLFGMNFTPELEPYRSTDKFPQFAVNTEIEYAVVICPGRPFVYDDKDSWNMFMTTTNFGSLGGPDIYTWEYYPEMINDGFEGSVICGTNPDDLALSITQAGEDIKWFPTTNLEVNYYYYDDSDSIEIEQLHAEFYHNHPSNQLPLEVDYMGIGLDPGEGKLAGHPLGDMVIQKYVLHATSDIVDSLEWAIFFDWDVNYGLYVSANPSFGGGDMLTNTMWGYDSTRENKVLYLTLAPTDSGKIPRNMMIFDQNSDIYDHVPCGPYDSLKAKMESVGPWFPTVKAENSDWYDYGYLMTSPHFVLDSCEYDLEEYLIWYDWQTPESNYLYYKCKLYRLLRGAGFYRGDVGNFETGAASPGVLDVADIVFLAYWMWRAGPDPEPFIDQGDVDCDGEVTATDLVYLVNFILRGQIDKPPTDKDRFFDTEASPWPEYELRFTRSSLFVDPQWGSLGVGCYPYRP
jgi:hypothetical protein